jgi:hypothetical protein
MIYLAIGVLGLICTVALVTFCALILAGRADDRMEKYLDGNDN